MSAYTLWLARLMATCLVLIMPSSQTQAADSAKPGNTKIIKWVDDKGMTHYGDTLPTQFSNKNSVINSQGITIQRNDPKSQSMEESPEVTEQKRKDRALMASFTNENEIDLARDRHLQMDEITVQGLQQRRVTATKQLESNKKFADGFKQRNKPVPPDLDQDLKDNQAEIGRIDAQIKQQADIMDATRKRFAADKQRFIDLKAHKGN